MLDIEERRLVTKPEYVGQEGWMETVEGTAEFMGIPASRAVGYDFGIMYFDNTRDVPFSDVIPFCREGKLKENFLRDRLPYETGGQITLLLDGIDPAGTCQDYLNGQTPSERRTLVDALTYVLDGS